MNSLNLNLFTRKNIGINRAAEIAQVDINKNGTILQDVELVVMANYAGCHLDTGKKNK